jgi:ABC-type sugar transport system ATPase subunit
MNLITGRYEDGILYLPGNNAYKVPERWMKPLANHPRGDKFTLGFRPEGAVLEENGQINAEVYASDLHGAYMMLHMALDPDTPETLIHARAGRGGHHAIGEKIQFDIDPAMVRFFDHETGKALLPEENNG